MASTKVKYSGVQFASAYEASLAKHFDSCGYVWEYEPVRIPWVPAVRYYRPDFRITIPETGESFFVEAKGYFDGSARSKMACVKAQHPDIDIRFVFMRGKNTISSKSDLTYTEWATKYGFPYFTVNLTNEEKQHAFKTDAHPTTRKTKTQGARNNSSAHRVGQSVRRTRAQPPVSGA